MSRFERVILPDHRQLRRRASQTLLRHYQACPRSGYFYALHKGDAQTIEMVRGSAVHEVFERCTKLMIAEGEQTIPPEIVKDVVNDVLAEMPVPFAEHDYIREMSFRWANEWSIDPAAVIACETLIVLELEGWNARCKVDFAESRALGTTIHVADYKSSRAAPGYEEIARKRSDGRLSAKTFQLILYALALAFGRPVRVEAVDCPECEGSGYHEKPAHEWDAGEPCAECEGRGIIHDEILEPMPLAGRAEMFELEFVFPAIENREGEMIRRPVTLSRLELAEYRESLVGLLRRLEESERTGVWDAILSDEACKECPCPSECPIPKELRDHAGEINSLEEAAEAAEIFDRRADENSALRSEIKRFAKGHDVEIRYGKDKALRFGTSTSDRIERKDEMFEAIARAVDYGEPFDRSQFVRTVESTTFGPVKLTDDELAEEAKEGAASE